MSQIQPFGKTGSRSKNSGQTDVNVGEISNRRTTTKKKAVITKAAKGRRQERREGKLRKFSKPRHSAKCMTNVV